MAETCNPDLWCRHCEEPVQRVGTGYGEVAVPVHAGPGEVLCADGRQGGTA